MILIYSCAYFFLFLAFLHYYLTNLSYLKNQSLNQKSLQWLLQTFKIFCTGGPYSNSVKFFFIEINIHVHGAWTVNDGQKIKKKKKKACKQKKIVHNLTSVIKRTTYAMVLKFKGLIIKIFFCLRTDFLKAINLGHPLNYK